LSNLKPFVKTNKNDASDAEAICEALIHPTMRFAPIKGAEQQSVLMLHRAQELLVCQKTMLINALRGHCGEFGLVVAKGASRVVELITVIKDPADVCASYLFTALELFCCGRGVKRRIVQRGRKPCWRTGPPMLFLWQWPTRQLVLCGRCSAGVKHSGLKLR
jgi:hypothetical protein